MKKILIVFLSFFSMVSFTKCDDTMYELTQEFINGPAPSLENGRAQGVSLKRMQELLDCGVDVNTNHEVPFPEYRSALSQAVEVCDAGYYEFLMKHGANFRKSNAICANYSAKSLAFLQDQGIDLNMAYEGTGYGLVVDAVFHGNAESLAYLLDKGISLTPLYYGTYSDNFIVLLLVRLGERIEEACVDYLSPMERWFDLHKRIQADVDRTVQCLRLLLDQGVDPNAGEYFTVPIVIAASFHLHEIAEVLIEGGVSVSERPYSGYYQPIDIAYHSWKYKKSDMNENIEPWLNKERYHACLGTLAPSKTWHYWIRAKSIRY